MLRYYIFLIVPLSVLIPIFFALLNYGNLKKPHKIILLFLLVSGVADLINLLLGAHHIPNAIIYHIYTVFEFALISLFYACFLKKNRHKIINWLIGIFAVLCVVNYLFIQNSLVVNTYTRSLEAVIIIAYCIFYINQQNSNNSNDDYNWSANTFNWINAGILVYYASDLFFFIFTNYLIKTGLNAAVWALADTFLLIEYILFAIGFYKCKT